MNEKLDGWKNEQRRKKFNLILKERRKEIRKKGIEIDG